MDLHDLVRRKLDWDDKLPNELRELWLSHFDMMKEMKNIKYQRTIVPADAASLEISTLDFGDASKDLVCISIYARFKRREGGYSSQLVFARSRIVPDDMKPPRSELYAALVNAHAGDVVRKALSRNHIRKLKFTDSQIVLYWITNKNLQLKQWVRSRVTEILRVTNSSQWKYVKSEDMIVDLGTQRCTSVQEIQPSSVWVNGFKWMKEDEFPFLPCLQIKSN